jgi:hypothetical protein
VFYASDGLHRRGLPTQQIGQNHDVTKSATVSAGRTKTCQEEKASSTLVRFGLVCECAPGKVVIELLFSHQNDAQLLLTGSAKASPKKGGSSRNRHLH